MKTTENISLAGYAFTIETDAYETLSRYLAEIRKGFEGDPSADEIVSDIEERIAELLSERCPVGMVVNVSMIEDIRKRIGDPEVLAQTESDNAGTPAPEPKEEKKTSRSKRLYRNMEERIFGGVCSGLGSYFGIDKVIFRLIFLIIFFMFCYRSTNNFIVFIFKTHNFNTLSVSTNFTDLICYKTNNCSVIRD